MEKYGFIYLWYDRKHKRYYLGKHWGHEKDNYVCSSVWMKQAYRHRPDDFHRKVLERVYTTKKDLADAEYRWGSLIKEEELGKKYYNLKIPKDHHWHDDPDKLLSVSEKISKSMQNRTDEEKRDWKEKVSKTKTGVSNPKQAEAIRGRSLSEGHKQKLSGTLKGRPGQSPSPEARERISKTLAGRTLSEDHKAKITKGLVGFQFKDPEGRGRKISAALKGKFLSEEHKQKLSEAKRGKSGPNRGRKFSEEHRRKLSECKKRKALERSME